MTQQERQCGPLFLCKRTGNLLLKNYDTEQLEIQKKLDIRTLKSFSCPSSFFEKKNKEKAWKIQRKAHQNKIA